MINRAERLASYGLPYMATNLVLAISRGSFPGGSVVKNPPASVGDMHSIPGWGRAPGGGNGNPIQYSCLEDPINRGACWATVHGVAESDTTERLSACACTHTHTLICSPQCCVSILKTWRLASLRVSHPRKGKPHRSCVTFHDLALNIT